MAQSTEALTRTVKELTSAPATKELPSGMKVEVLICKTRHLPTLLQLLATVMEPLNIKLSQKPKPGEITAMLDNASFVLNIASANFPLVIEAVRTLTPLTREQIEDLDIDDLIALIDAIIRRNYDFFMQRLLPAIAKYLPATVPAPEENPGAESTSEESTPVS